VGRAGTGSLRMVLLLPPPHDTPRAVVALDLIDNATRGTSDRAGTGTDHGPDRPSDHRSGGRANGRAGGLLACGAGARQET
jgi:hypothetical protein